MTAIVYWLAFVFSLCALADAIAHGAWIATVVLALGTHAILRAALFPKRRADTV